ncbi:hypothetical protein ABZ921_16190 [Streptomyces atriruber]|uniref:Uncharacterized protein n=1 Tax=Streptomyces atriruber TaxID=545121 RepID=A0ABV3BPB4_9ACTN
MALVFGFLDGQMTTLQEQGVEVDETYTVEPGQTVIDSNGDVYTVDDPSK